ncbi:hypothetical protein [Sphingosinicella sp. BN140058]|uniref:hypothetical protein n=1 Tax=Sphingosinicella sp. BN140058 TaxID=1892855 RepID=UPI001011101F|nr:hypothetical protein [Sphingosinicella sp. BN140058]QAY80288.1 hypothetical protein ETR14_26970 [Sphingosinicella sp. BN140058]
MRSMFALPTALAAIFAPWPACASNDDHLADPSPIATAAEALTRAALCGIAGETLAWRIEDPRTCVEVDIDSRTIPTRRDIANDTVFQVEGELRLYRAGRTSTPVRIRLSGILMQDSVAWTSAIAIA